MHTRRNAAHIRGQRIGDACRAAAAQTEITPGSSVGKALPTRSIVVMTFAFCITLAVLWEFLEWAGNAFITKGIHVGYIDSLIDIAIGGAGAIIAGALLAHWKDQAADIQSSARP